MEIIILGVMCFFLFFGTPLLWYFIVLLIETEENKKKYGSRKRAFQKALQAKRNKYFEIIK